MHQYLHERQLLRTDQDRVMILRLCMHAYLRWSPLFVRSFVCTRGRLKICHEARPLRRHGVALVVVSSGLHPVHSMH